MLMWHYADICGSHVNSISFLPRLSSLSFLVSSQLGGGTVWEARLGARGDTTGVIVAMATLGHRGLLG